MLPKIVLANIPKVLLVKYIGANILHGFGVGVYGMFGLMGFVNIYEVLKTGETMVELSFYEGIVAIIIVLCSLFIIIRSGKMVDDLLVSIIEANGKEG